MASLSAFTGNVPQHYETYLGPLFFEPYAVDIAARIEKARHQTILELACGTGRVTKHLLAKLPAQGRLVATDLNEAMLTVAREKVQDDRIQWQAADAQALPYGDDTFDLAVCQYGVMFFPDKDKAFKEAARVLKSGGTFLFNAWDHLRHNALAQAAREVTEELFPDEPPTFLEKGPYSLFDKAAIERLTEAAGFIETGIETVSLIGIAATAGDAVNGIIDGTPISGFLHERGADVPAVKEKLRSRLQSRYGNINISLPMQAFVCRAVKP